MQSISYFTGPRTTVVELDGTGREERTPTLAR